MAEYIGQVTLNGITYSHIPDKSQGTEVTVLNQDNVPAKPNKQLAYLTSNNFFKLINAIDIDWNGIVIDQNTTIDDTDQLINWIKGFETNINSNTSSINTLSNNLSNLLGTVTEEVESPDTHEIVTRIKKFTNNSGNLSGHDWATSFEEINTLLNNASFASNVQDNAEENTINIINFTNQDLHELTGDANDSSLKLGSLTLNNKTANISIDVNLLKKIQQNTLNNAKDYVDKKLTWSVT